MTKMGAEGKRWRRMKREDRKAEIKERKLGMNSDRNTFVKAILQNNFDLFRQILF